MLLRCEWQSIIWTHPMLICNIYCIYSAITVKHQPLKGQAPSQGPGDESKLYAPQFFMNYTHWWKFSVCHTHHQNNVFNSQDDYCGNNRSIIVAVWHHYLNKSNRIPKWQLQNPILLQTFVPKLPLLFSTNLSIQRCHCSLLMKD